MKNPELHWSQLRHIDKSPAHYLAALKEPREQTPAMRFGTLVHALVLGGQYVVYDGERRGKVWAEFQAANEGAFIVTASEHERARYVAETVRRDPVAKPLLEGITELAWERQLYGRHCAGRADVFKKGSHLVDLKTTADAHPERFSRHALKFGWHGQLAFYRDALEHRGPCFIIAVETAAPYAVTVLELTERALLEGDKLNRLWLERLAACEAIDHWPGYVQMAWPLDIVEDSGLIIGDEEEIAA